jgi:arylsulfatase A-like enzyme
MPVFKGQGSGDIYSGVYNIPSMIQSFSLVNTSGGSVTTTVYVADGTPTDLAAITAIDLTLKVGQAYVREMPIKIAKNEQIHIVSSGTIDYYFSID